MAHFEIYLLFWKHLPIISKTPLHHAADKGHVEVVKLLVECGADINMKTVSEREMYLPKYLILIFVRITQAYTNGETHSCIVHKRHTTGTQTQIQTKATHVHNHIHTITSYSQ